MKAFKKIVNLITLILGIFILIAFILSTYYGVQDCLGITGIACNPGLIIVPVVAFMFSGTYVLIKH